MEIQAAGAVYYIFRSSDFRSLKGDRKAVEELFGAVALSEHGRLSTAFRCQSPLRYVGRRKTWSKRKRRLSRR